MEETPRDTKLGPVLIPMGAASIDEVDGGFLVLTVVHWIVMNMNLFEHL
jgi:hypothetical protein